jgi:hypothetical protein
VRAFGELEAERFELNFEEGGFHGPDALAAEPGEGEVMKGLFGIGLGVLGGEVAVDLIELGAFGCR